MRSGCSVPVGAVSGASKEVRFTGGYETRDGGILRVGLHRSGAGRAAGQRSFWNLSSAPRQSQNLEVAFALTFDGGLALQGDSAEKLERPPVAVRERGRLRIRLRGGTRVTASPLPMAPLDAPESAPRYELSESAGVTVRLTRNTRSGRFRPRQCLI